MASTDRSSSLPKNSAWGAGLRFGDIADIVRHRKGNGANRIAVLPPPGAGVFGAVLPARPCRSARLKSSTTPRPVCRKTCCRNSLIFSASSIVYPWSSLALAHRHYGYNQIAWFTKPEPFNIFRRRWSLNVRLDVFWSGQHVGLADDPFDLLDIEVTHMRRGLCSSTGAPSRRVPICISPPLSRLSPERLGSSGCGPCGVARADRSRDTWHAPRTGRSASPSRACARGMPPWSRVASWRKMHRSTVS